jgi:hypothetical protein
MWRTAKKDFMPDSLHIGFKDGAPAGQTVSPPNSTSFPVVRAMFQIREGVSDGSWPKAHSDLEQVVPRGSSGR